MRGPLTAEYALPRNFVLFLSQVYGFVDESPEHAKPPAVVLQMTLFGPPIRHLVGFASACRAEDTSNAASTTCAPAWIPQLLRAIRAGPQIELKEDSTSSAISMPVDLMPTNEPVSKGDEK